MDMRFVRVLALASMLRMVASQATNSVDLQVLHEMMYSINFEYNWDSYYPDPCISGPQGIVCEADPVTNLYYVTQMQFGYISPIANLIPCSWNATIPASIANLTRLDTLSFYNCFSISTVSIPEDISSLGPTLRRLSFSGNPGLTGAIPSGLGKLTGLQRLVLSQNGLQGRIPEELGNLQCLIQLDFSHNNLSGSVPETFGAMNSLVNLDLRYNHLDGTLPPSLTQGLPQLQRLALSHNHLSGSLPDTFTGLNSLTFLDLSHNELTGLLPPSLGHLTNLEDLFLNSNSLVGNIPAPIGMLKSLVRLDLSSCSFGNKIPDSLKNLENLRFLSISNNKLSGPIPASLASLPQIFTLNLDGNQLTGPVPFPASFVKKMGRNMRLGDNPGLCFNSQLVSVKIPDLGLNHCADPPTMPANAPRSPLATLYPNATIRQTSLSLFQWSFWTSTLALLFLEV